MQCKGRLENEKQATYGCEICGCPDFVRHKTREMMFGYGDESEYLECTSCGRLKIAKIPTDLEKYYPTKDYYSYQLRYNTRVRLRRWALRSILALPRFVQRAVPMDTLAWIHSFALDRSMKILDVGSGSAIFVRDLRAAGFVHALGIDPFLEKDIVDNSGLAGKKIGLEQVSGLWDRIMFHHSLEHFPDQIATLAAARVRLSAQGICIVRIPIINWAWKEYGTNWVQLDSPRHFGLHTEKSFRMAAHRADLIVSQVIYDSTAFQFFGSELYKRGIPLVVGKDHLYKYFTLSQMRHFSRRAEELNRKSLGDQAVFFLVPKHVLSLNQPLEVPTLNL